VTRELLVIVWAVVLPACASELKTAVLTPSQVATAVKRAYYYDKDPDWASGCKPQRKEFSCYGRYGVKPDDVGDAPVAAGLLHDYASAGDLFGIGLASCEERINCIYRALMLFDLTPLGSSPKVVTAKLKYQVTVDKHNHATQWSSEEDCIAKLGFLLSPWGGFDLPAEFLGGDFSAQGLTTGGIDVSTVVRGWADGSIPNHGFILIGPKESTGHNDDDRCTAKLTNLRLEVQVNVKSG
jgi:hypothetical protein